MIALTRNNVIQQMARANALQSGQPGTRAWHRVPEPWTSPDFFPGVQRQIADMVVSHRPERKVSGELHGGTNYPRPRIQQGKSILHSRLQVSALGGNTGDAKKALEKVDCIVDPVVREAVRTKLLELGGDPRLFEQPGNGPVLPAGNGRSVPIRKVRTSVSKDPLPAGSGPKLRWTESGGIHHVSLFVRRDHRGREFWDSSVVQITEAYRRAPRFDRRDRDRNKFYGAVVRRTLSQDTEAEFLFSLCKDDTIEVELEGNKQILRAKKFGDNGQMWFVPVNDAHTDADQKKFGITWSKKPATLKYLQPRKVVVDLLGRIHPASD